jgi:catechol 2,3-dioxygenase-like lactoylglutathione lyase family enzyme
MDGDRKGFHPEAYQGQSPIKVNKLGHLVYEVSDMERSVKFWTEVMGFHETDRNDIGMVFLRCGADHHAIGLKPGTAPRRGESKEALQVEHLALEVADIDMLLKARD